MRVYVVIDEEMCAVQKGYKWKDYPYLHEIIQIGAVMMNEDFEMIDSFSTFVLPKYGRIDHFVQNLTGINEKQIKDAPDLQGALRNMISWIGDKEPVFYAWSESDYSQLSKEITAKGLDPEEMAIFLDKDLWIDYQKIAGERFQKPWKLPLEEALGLAEVELEGRQHDGLVDAKNTARLIAKMEKNKESRFLLDRLEKDEKTESGIGMSLGNLLQGIHLD